jgi:hypothetical protein
MKGSTGRKKEDKKKPYVRPEVKQVLLRPEEAVLGFCKTTSLAGPLQSTCSFPGPCSGMGS